MMTSEDRLSAILDETLALSGFAEEVLAIAHTLIGDAELKLMVRRDLAAVRIFSAKIHAQLMDLHAASANGLPAPTAEATGTTCLPLRELRDDVALASWCSGSEAALQQCLDIAVASQVSAPVEKMLRKQLARILRRRARLEVWIARHEASTELLPHVLLVRLSATQGSAVEREFMLRNIPCVIANGVGEAMFRVVRRRPLMVLMNPSHASDAQSVVDALESKQPNVPVLSVSPLQSDALISGDVQEALSAISAAAARFARGRTN